MDEFWWQTLWMATATVVIAYPSMLFLGSISVQRPLDDTIIAFDAVEGSTHTLTGTLVVPSECHGLGARVVELEAATSTYRIEFTTWQEPYRDCPRTRALKRFRVVTFAPENVQFIATFDGDPLDLHVIEHRVQ